MSDEIKKLQPTEVWECFFELTQIPRPSKHEERISDYMENFGKSLGLETIRDHVGNIVIRKPATPGYEDRTGVILQSHLDMVPQKNSDVKHDFLTDPIDAYVDGDWVRARGTTLGADNGMGVAAAMAVLKSKTLKHGPLEALFTIDEETGMTGAFELKPNILKGEILMNLDSEAEGELYVGCSGGLDSAHRIPFDLEPVGADRVGVRVDVKGLLGGHSGMDIILGRGNSIKLLMRALFHLEEFDVRFIELEGGSLRNAIPREAHAVLAVPGGKADAFIGKINELDAIYKSELKGQDAGVTLTAEKVPITNQMFSQKSHQAVVRSVLAAANGVIRMSDAMPGLVETSNNFASLKIEGRHVVGQCLLRSSVDSAKIALAELLDANFQMVGAESTFNNGYPGWNPNMDSPILAAMRETYKKEFGKEAKIMAIHAGLECGILAGNYPHLDMISFGPTILSPHSPDERVNIETVGLFWKFLGKVLENTPRK